MAKQSKASVYTSSTTTPVVGKVVAVNESTRIAAVDVAAKTVKEQMEAPLPPSCSSCRYFSAERVNANNGKCRHHAPQPNTNISVLTVWPIVKADDWCGEYEKRQA